MSLRAGRSLSSRINALLIAPGDTGAETALGYGAAHIHTLVLAAIFPLFSMTTAVQFYIGLVTSCAAARCAPARRGREPRQVTACPSYPYRAYAARLCSHHVDAPSA